MKEGDCLKENEKVENGIIHCILETCNRSRVYKIYIATKLYPAIKEYEFAEGSLG